MHILWDKSASKKITYIYNFKHDVPIFGLSLQKHTFISGVTHFTCNRYCLFSQPNSVFYMFLDFWQPWTSHFSYACFFYKKAILLSFIQIENSPDALALGRHICSRKSHKLPQPWKMKNKILDILGKFTLRTEPETYGEKIESIMSQHITFHKYSNKGNTTSKIIVIISTKIFCLTIIA